MKEYTQARQAFEKGLELEPQNKIFLSLATKAKELEQVCGGRKLVVEPLRGGWTRLRGVICC